MNNISDNSPTNEHISHYDYIYACVLAVFAYASLFGTVLSIAVLVKGRLLKESSYIIMCSLALADIGDISVMTFHSLPERILDIQWSDASERVANRVTLVCWFAALGHYVIMASYRFTAVRYPFKMNVWFSVERTKSYVVLTWMVGLCICAVSFTGVCCDQIFSIHENIDPAIETATDSVGETNYLKKITKIVDLVVIALLILIYITTYLGINKIVPSTKQIKPTDLRQENENKRRAAQTKRISLQFAIISAIFGFLVTAQALSDSGIGGIILTSILQFAFLLNAGANVVIYSVFNSTFRKQLIGTIFFWKKNATN